MSSFLKKMKNKENKILTETELQEIKNRIFEIKNEFIYLNNFPKDKSYFKKVKELGDEMGSLQKRLRQGLKINKKYEKENKK